MALTTNTTTLTVGSDGILAVELTDLAGAAIDVELYQFRIELYDGRTACYRKCAHDITDENKYIISYNGTSRLNNKVEDGKLYFFIDRYALSVGTVYYSQYETFASEDFEEGKMVQVCYGELSLNISADGCSTASENSVLTLSSVAFKGAPGRTPQKGVDYFTPAEIEQIENNASSAATSAALDVVNPKLLALDGKIPTKVSDLTNDRNYTTLAAVFEQVYKKSETFTKTEVRDLVSIVQGELDTLVGGNASSAIDSFNEIRAFLASFTDAQDLASILLALKNEIVALMPNVPSWALEAAKPSYTAEEVGALPANTELFDGDYNSLDNKPNIPSTEGLAEQTTIITDGDTTIELVDNTLYVFTEEQSELTISKPSDWSESDIAHLSLKSGETATSVTFGEGIVVSGSINASSYVEISVMGSVALVTSIAYEE